MWTRQPLGGRSGLSFTRRGRVDDPRHLPRAQKLMGQGESVPVHEGKLVLGTYQSVIFLELDGQPERQRKIGVQVHGLR